MPIKNNYEDKEKQSSSPTKDPYIFANSDYFTQMSSNEGAGESEQPTQNPQINPQPEEGGNDFDYYQALKDENYKSLLNNQVQLANARQQALKNTNVGLSAMGFNSAGYGALSRQGIENSYMQGLEANQENYANQNLDISRQQYEAEKAETNENFQSFNNIIGKGIENQWITTVEQLDDYFKRYGFIDDEGNFDKEAIAAKYGKESANQMELVYEMWKSQLQESETSESNASTSYNIQEAKTNFVDSNGKTGTMNDELGFIYGSGSQYLAKEGNVLMVKQNNTSGASYMYLMYSDGAWKQVDSATYHNASSSKQYEVYSDKNSNLYYNITHEGNTTKYGKGGKQKDWYDANEVKLSVKDRASLELLKASNPTKGAAVFTVGGQKWKVVWNGSFEQWYKVS